MALPNESPMEQVSRRICVFNPDFRIYTPEPDKFHECELSKFVYKQICIRNVEYLTKSNLIRGVSPVVLDGLSYLSIYLGGQNIDQVLNDPNKLQKFMNKIARKPLIPLDVNVLTIRNIHPKLLFNDIIDLSSLEDCYYLELAFSTINNKAVAPKITKWPPKLKYLAILGYNHPLENLPEGLLTLWLGKEYTQHLNALPSTTLHITFSDRSYFNSPLDNLPFNTQSIYFGSCSKFRQPTNLLPLGLQEFIMKHPRYPTPTEFSNFPPNLKRLSITVPVSTQKVIGLPSKLEFFAIDKNYFEDGIYKRDEYLLLTSENFQLPATCSHIMISDRILANITGNDYNLGFVRSEFSVLHARVRELYPFVQHIDGFDDVDIPD
jgi:hypothetical protein